MKKVNRFRAIWHVMRQRGKWHQNYFCMEKRRWRAFYATKTIVCMLICRRRNLYAVSDTIDSMAMFDASTYSTMESMYPQTGWTEVAVGEGVFRRWYYDIYDNSSD
jgi:hypothetical protein